MMLLTYFMSSSRQGQLWKKKNGFSDKTLVSLLPPLDHILKSTKKLFFKRKEKRFEIGEVKCQTIVKSWRSSNHYWKNAHNNDGAQGKKVTLLLPNALGKGRKRSRWHACSSSLFSPHRITEALETLLARNSTLERAKNGMKEEKQKILSSPVIVALTSEKPPWDN